MSLDDRGREQCQPAEKPTEDQIEQAKRRGRDHAWPPILQVTRPGRLLEPHRVIFQVFAALEARVSTPAPSSTALTSSLHYHLVPVVVWALVPVGYFALTPNFAERTVSGIISVAWSAEDHRNSFSC
jgi:hypothetical protein